MTRDNGTVTSWNYDPVSRLSSLAHNLGGTVNDVSTSFTYNPASQIDSLTKSNDAYAWGSHTNIDRVSAGNGLNQLKSATPGGGQVSVPTLTYDARGNLTGSGSQAYIYTSQNRLVDAPGQTSLSGDGLERTTYIGASNTLFGHDGANIVMEGPYNGGISPVARRYVHGPGSDTPIVWYEGSGTSDKRYLTADERGSIVAVTDASGNAIQINTYDEYGIPAATNLGRFQYTGQAWLPEVGMYYYKARMYSPTLGRFMQTDPIGYADGMNWYNYVGSDPVNKVDPGGLCATQSEHLGTVTGSRISRCLPNGYASADGRGSGGSGGSGTIGVGGNGGAASGGSGGVGLGCIGCGMPGDFAGNVITVTGSNFYSLPAQYSPTYGRGSQRRIDKFCR